jgi:hypothetical protein
MTPAIYQLLLPTLRATPTPLSRLHALAREAGSEWSLDQIRLFCTVMEGLGLTGDGDDPLVQLGGAAPAERLLDAVIAVLHARGGGPLAIDEIIKLLPPEIPTSAAQIRALAKENPARLRIFGPGLIQLNDHV